MFSFPKQQYSGILRNQRCALYAGNRARVIRGRFKRGQLRTRIKEAPRSVGRHAAGAEKGGSSARIAMALLTNSDFRESERLNRIASAEISNIN